MPRMGYIIIGPGCRCSHGEGIAFDEVRLPSGLRYSYLDFHLR